MKRIICLSIFLLLLCTSIALTKSKFEAGLLFGSYYPSFSRHPHTRDVFGLNGDSIKGYVFGYQITPELTIRLQIDSFQIEKPSPTAPQGLKIKATTISLSGTIDLFQYENYKIYGGVGLVDRRVKVRWSGFGNLPYYAYDFAPPWGAVLLFGVGIPLGKFCLLKGEIQYVTGDDGELYYIPLDWNGPKFLVSLGIKF